MTFTIATAARFLEVPEHVVRARMADGTFDVVGKGPYGRLLLDGAHVRQYARMQRLGELGRRQKLVLVIGGLTDQQQALRVAGLTPERATGILDALGQHDVPGAPIIVATPQAVNAELEILKPILGQIHLAIVARSQTEVPWPLELSARILEPEELRALVTWAWQSLDARTEAGLLDL